MHDIRPAVAVSEIAAEFTLPMAYAMQCPAPDPKSPDFYIAQADKDKDPEDLLIVRNVVDPYGNVRMIAQGGYMRLLGAGHGTTISVFYRGGVLGIVCNAWGRLVWIPWAKGPVAKTDPKVELIFPGWEYAYIDHAAKTVCVRKGDLFRLHELKGSKLGVKIGKDVTGVTSPGPAQGYCTIKDGDGYQLFTLWDYGAITSKPMIVAGSFKTGKRLYAVSARVLPKIMYALTQEPEGAYGMIDPATGAPVFCLGMSTRGLRGKIPLAVRFDPRRPPPVPVTVVQPPSTWNVEYDAPILTVPLHGNDVASYQGTQWQPLLGDGFAFVKATEGTTYSSSVHGIQVATARKAGLVVGHYHFMRPGNAAEQARYFVAQADIKIGDLAVCDWENTGDGHPSVKDAADFIAEVKRLLPHNRCLLYCNQSDWTTTTVKAPDGLWIAQYGVDQPKTRTDWIFWQYTNDPIDRNWSKFLTLEDLRKWATL